MTGELKPLMPGILGLYFQPYLPKIHVGPDTLFVIFILLEQDGNCVLL